MNGKKILAIGLILVAVVALAPLLIYGPFVTEARVELGLTITSTPVPAKSDNHYLQPPTFGVALDYATVDVTSVNAYQHLANRLTGMSTLIESSNPAEAFVTIVITFNLTTPSNHNLLFTMNPITGSSVGEKQIRTQLGPEEGVRESGEFHLTITITVSITPPGFTTPIVDLNLGPVTRSFTVP